MLSLLQSLLVSLPLRNPRSWRQGKEFGERKASLWLRKIWPETIQANSMRMQPWALRELAEVTAKLLFIMFNRLWRMEEVPEDWRKASVSPGYKKSKQKELQNYKPVSLTSIPGEVMEQLMLEAISKHVEEKRVIRTSQHGLTTAKSHLTNLIALCVKTTKNIFLRLPFFQSCHAFLLMLITVVRCCCYVASILCQWGISWCCALSGGQRIAAFILSFPTRFGVF